MAEHLISLTDVDHFYGGGRLRKQILFSVDADVAPGEIVILTGPSGSGKTTLLTLIGGLRRVQSGSVRVLGRELRDAAASEQVAVRRRIGYIFQAHNLLSALSARQNVEMSPALNGTVSRAEAAARASAMLAAVGLGDRADAKPHELSGGQKQRVAIARALVSQPEIVLADEPTAALDKTSGREVVELLHRLAREHGAAILLVTHDNRILDLADRLFDLEDGRLEARL